MNDSCQRVHLKGIEMDSIILWRQTILFRLFKTERHILKRKLYKRNFLIVILGVKIGIPIFINILNDIYQI